MTLSNLQTFEPEFEPSEINRGNYGIVYRTGENHAAKVLFKKDLDGTVRFQSDESSLLNLMGEYEITKTLFENGVSVPQPFGIFKIPISNMRVPGFVMQYIDGKRAFELSDPEYNEAMLLAENELREAKMLGFEPVDATARNVLWCPREGKPYLIDFGSWTSYFPEWGME